MNVNKGKRSDIRRLHSLDGNGYQVLTMSHLKKRVAGLLATGNPGLINPWLIIQRFVPFKPYLFTWGGGVNTFPIVNINLLDNAYCPPGTKAHFWQGRLRPSKLGARVCGCWQKCRSNSFPRGLFGSTLEGFKWVCPPWSGFKGKSNIKRNTTICWVPLFYTHTNGSKYLF